MVVLICIQILIEHSVSIQQRHDQTRRSKASGVGLYCLSMSHKKDARLK